MLPKFSFLIFSQTQEQRDQESIFYRGKRVTFRFPKLETDHLIKEHNSHGKAMKPEEIEKLRKFHKSLKSKFLDNTKTMMQFQFLSTALKHLRNQKNLVGVIRCVRRDVKSFMMCEDTNIYINDHYIQKAYQQEGGATESCRLEKGQYTERALFK